MPLLSSGVRYMLLSTVFFAFVGVVVRGVDTRVDPMQRALGVTAALAARLSYTSIRNMEGQEQPLVVVFYS